jgi:multisubunit Na+/H+ antiporter MnhE subunit
MKNPAFQTGTRLIIFFILFLVLAAKLTVTEVIAGLCVAVVVITSSKWIRAKARLRFRVKPGWTRLLFKRVAVKTVTDCGWVFLALWRYAIHRKPIQGRLWSIPFEPGGEDDESASRRALVLAMVSITPNTLAIAIDRKKGVLILHQLVYTGKEPGQGDQKWPI